MMFIVMCCMYFFFFKQKTAYEMRISDWSSDLCSSDLIGHHACDPAHVEVLAARAFLALQQVADIGLHRRFPEALVGHVDREFLRLFRDAHAARDRKSVV